MQILRVPPAANLYGIGGIRLSPDENGNITPNHSAPKVEDTPPADIGQNNPEKKPAPIAENAAQYLPEDVKMGFSQALQALYLLGAKTAAGAISKGLQVIGALLREKQQLEETLSAERANHILGRERHQAALREHAQEVATLHRKHEEESAQQNRKFIAGLGELRETIAGEIHRTIAGVQRHPPVQGVSSRQVPSGETQTRESPIQETTQQPAAQDTQTQQTPAQQPARKAATGEPQKKITAAKPGPPLQPIDVRYRLNTLTYESTDRRAVFQGIVYYTSPDGRKMHRRFTLKVRQGSKLPQAIILLLSQMRYFNASKYVNGINPNNKHNGDQIVDEFVPRRIASELEPHHDLELK